MIPKNTIPNEQDLKWTPSQMDTTRMDTISNGHHLEWAPSRIDTIPNEHLHLNYHFGFL